MKIAYSAHQQLLKLPPDKALALIDALSKYENRQRGYIKWLDNRPGYRIVIDAFRVLFEFDETANEIIALKLLHSPPKRKESP